MDKIYNIRLCKTDELYKLRIFIDNHWKKGHILCSSDEMFHFQHKNEENDNFFNFVVAENSVTGEFDGVFGFILSDIYDRSKKVACIKWSAIWKVREDVKNKEIRSIGLALFKYVLDFRPEVPYVALGMSESNIAICKALHFTNGALAHYYIANEKTTDFRIAKNPLFNIAEIPTNSVNAIHKIDDISSISDIYNPINPYKNLEYFNGRYSQHPIYKYDYYGITSDGALKLIIAVRKINILNTCVLRIVDMIGSFDDVYSIYNLMQSILQKENAEYIDCYNSGIEMDHFINSGFNIVKGDTIIPDYFEPFECRNVTLNYAHSSDKNMVIFKGDADQDRPSIIKSVKSV